MNFSVESSRVKDYVIETRRMLHMNPEISLEEIKTSNFVAQELERMNIEVIRLEKNGVIGKIVGNPVGKRIAIRADMDALPMQEENRDKGYCSQIDGKMHSCGHDGHTAILLGTAEILKKYEDKLNGTVYLCFQGAEEIGDGVDVIINYLKEEGGVDNIIASHLWAEIDSGEISIVEGPRMAAGGGWKAKVKGKGGHASRPDLTIDPIRPACSIALAVTSIPTNYYKSIEPLVVTCAVINGGTVRNIIPETVHLEGGIRSFSIEGRETAKKYIKQMSTNIAEAYGAEIELIFDDGIPPVYNDKESVDRGRKVVERMGTFNLVEYEQICASENFGMLLEEFPGFLAFVGIRNEEKGLIYGQHNPKFDIDEDVMDKVIEFYLDYTFDFLD